MILRLLRAHIFELHYSAQKCFIHMFIYIREGKKKGKWTPEEEEQLQRLYEEYKGSGGGVPFTVSVVWFLSVDQSSKLSFLLLLLFWFCFFLFLSARYC